MNQLPPPHRVRAISQPDPEVPEGVYRALLGVQESVETLSQTVALGRAEDAIKFTTLTEAVAKVVANDRTHIAKIFGIVAGAVVSLAGVVVAARPAPVPPQVTAVRSQADLDLDECRPLQPGSYERAECFERVSRGPARR